jgi:hypothetical protein
MSDPKRRARLLLWLRIVLSLGLLAVLVIKSPEKQFHSIIPSDNHARTITFLVLALVMALLGVLLQSWRWQRVLRLYDCEIPLRRLIRHMLVGLFVGNVLPSTIGGDVIRVSRVGVDTNSSEIAFASVALERMTGFLVLPLLVAIGIVLKPSLLSEEHAWLAPVVAVGTLAVLGLLILLAAHPRFGGRFKDRQNWLRFVGAVHRGVDDARANPRQALAIFGVSMLYQASVILSVVFIATAIEIPAPVIAIIAFFPAVAMVQVLPISLSGLGVREGMLVLFLVPLGVTRDKAIGLGLMWYASLLIVSVLGAPAFAAGKRKRVHTASHTPTPGTPTPVGTEP